MLLAEYLVEAGLATGDRTALRLGDIYQFEFGEQYVIRLVAGKAFVIPDLDAVLGIMESEYSREPGAWPAVRVLTRFDTRTRRASEFLAATVGGVSTRPGIPVHTISKLIRMSVVDYSLTGSWDYLRRGIQ